MFVDEEIIKRKKLLRQMAENAEREQVQTENEMSVLDGTVSIYGEEFIFERRKIDETPFSIIIPVVIEKLDEETMNRMFPMGNDRLNAAYSSVRDLFNLTVNKTEVKVPQEHIVGFTDASAQMLDRMAPQVKILKKYTYEIEEIQIGIMEYLTMAMDGKAYNFQCIFPFDDGVLLISFSFHVKVKERMYNIIKQMLSTIHFEDTVNVIK